MDVLSVIILTSVVLFIIIGFIILLFKFIHTLYMFVKEFIIFVKRIVNYVKRITNHDDEHEYMYVYDDYTAYGNWNVYNNWNWNWYSVQMFRRKTNRNSKRCDFEGVYIVHNIDTNKYYVGQSINVIKRLRSHFNGRSTTGGSDDLNNALINGDRLEVVLLALKDSNFRNLNDMESFFINHFDSYHNGYNRTRGNGRSDNKSIIGNAMNATRYSDDYQAKSFDLD